MLTIRLQRAGKKNKADFRIVLAQKTSASQKKFVEVIGSYNPHTKNLQIRDKDRLSYWIDDQHVELSPTVQNLLISKEIIKGEKAKAFTLPKKEVVAEETPAEPAASAENQKTTESPTEVPAPETATPETAPEVVADASSAEAPAEAPAEETAAEEQTPA
jgi:small subunit ribosomal protein S16